MLPVFHLLRKQQSGGAPEPLYLTEFNPNVTEVRRFYLDCQPVASNPIEGNRLKQLPRLDWK
jgi:hypothetical protein